MQTVRFCLIGLAWSVLFVGLVDDTLVSHAIQVLPIAVALRLLSRSPGYLGAYAAVSLFAWWTARSSLIWLYLLDVWTIAAGEYVPVEVALSVLVAFFGIAGILRGIAVARRLASSRKVMTVVVFTALQATAVATSCLLYPASCLLSSVF